MTSLRRRHFLAGASGAAVASGLGTGAADAAQGGPGRGRGVRTGADLAAADGWSELAGQKVGVITNPTGVLSDSLRSIVDEMHESGAVEIVGVFGPEHGFRGTAQAGESEDTFTDPRTGLTVYDAYGADADAMERMLTEAGVETLVFDIQDVGARFYTYIWTMYTAMRAAARTRARFVVLDRPNPLGGRARGPMMTEPYTSGVGAEAIVQAHGMTVGEVADYADTHFLPDDEGLRLAELHVVECRGWRRSSIFAETGLPWTPPSPNMPTADTALLYPGTGMFEGTNLSEGRGTARPFELIGAPFVDHRWATRLEERRIPGVAFREAYFVPTFGKHETKTCGGVQVHLTDPDRVDGVRVGVEMLVAAHDLYPKFAWREDDWDEKRPFWIDKLTGSDRLRTMIDGGADADEVVAAWSSEVRAFERRRRRHLRYR